MNTTFTSSPARLHFHQIYLDDEQMISLAVMQNWHLLKKLITD
jgi:hypothetical protein